MKRGILLYFTIKEQVSSQQVVIIDVFFAFFIVKIDSYTEFLPL